MTMESEDCRNELAEVINCLAAIDLRLDRLEHCLEETSASALKTRT